MPLYALPPMQLYVELTPDGGVLRPEPGVYSGPVVINKSITLDGGGEVTIDGQGDGTVIHLKRADGTVLRGLRIVNSGNSHDRMDSAIILEDTNNAVIERNRIENVLFGINLRKSFDNVVRDNGISSREELPSLRGEGLRIWYSSDNLFERNVLQGVRDILVINSPDNRFVGNRIADSRMGMELVFSPGNQILDNRFHRNTSGIVGIYSDDLLIRGNHFTHMRAKTGSALAIKESSQVVIEQNEVLHCSVGLIVNAPVHPENILYLRNNRVAYNDVAMYFYGEKGGHVIHGNRFEGNMTPIAVSAPTSALENDWKGNHWDDYQGFDRDGDGFGDSPFSIYLYSDRIWMDRPMTRFFRSSPTLELIDFMERLAPFSEPFLILRDSRPMM
jgi:nitrous oxidase accessory protein